MFRKLSFFYLILLISSQAHAAMLASDQNGNLVSIDLATGNGTFIGQEGNFPLATEIEYDNNSGILYGDEVNGETNLHTIDPATGLSTGFVTHGPAAFNGMEFVGNTLYVTNIQISGGPSTLETVDPATGVQTVIGATGFGPISGLAYDSASSTMYGVTAGGLPGMLVTIDLLTGIANPGVSILDSAGTALSSIGSIEFGTNGVLYGGMGKSGNINPGQLFSLALDGTATFLGGDSGLKGITGLTTITSVVPVPAAIWLFGTALFGLAGFSKRRKTA